VLIKKEQDEILSYLEDASNLKEGRAEFVFIPENENEAAGIVRECSVKKLPLTISAGGTGVVGGRVPLSGVVLSTERLNKIIEINAQEKYAVLQSGVIVDDFLKELSKQKLFYPPFPTERTAFIGGNIATNASGEYSFKFGCTREYVRSIKVVLSNGKLIRIRRGEHLAQGGRLKIPSSDISFRVPDYKMPNLKKNAAGYYAKKDMDLIDLFIGSEGTLGIITEVEVKVIKELPDVFFCAVFFKDKHNVFSMVTELKRRKDVLKDLLCLEYFDSNSLRLLKEFYPQIPEQAGEAILFAARMSSDKSLDMWDRFLTGYDSADTWFGDTEKQKRELFDFRHKLPEAVNDIVRMNNHPKISTDIVVPEDKFRQMDKFYREKLSNSKIEYVIFGHIGECHLHVNLLPKSEEELRQANRLNLEFAREAVSLGGTVSGEHGIGKRKHKLLEVMYKQEDIAQMVKIKKTLDKSCILCPGNIFPEDYLK